MARVKAAIIGSGNIGTDLMMKMIKYPQNMELAAVVGSIPRPKASPWPGSMALPRPMKASRD
jgi:acetaldehyde dehydrogenase (acetylating)